MRPDSESRGGVSRRWGSGLVRPSNLPVAAKTGSPARCVADSAWRLNTGRRPRPQAGHAATGGVFCGRSFAASPTAPRRPRIGRRRRWRRRRRRQRLRPMTATEAATATVLVCCGSGGGGGGGDRGGLRRRRRRRRRLRWWRRRRWPAKAACRGGCGGCCGRGGPGGGRGGARFLAGRRACLARRPARKRRRASTPWCRSIGAVRWRRAARGGCAAALSAARRRAASVPISLSPSPGSRPMAGGPWPPGCRAVTLFWPGSRATLGGFAACWQARVVRRPWHGRACCAIR